MNENKRIERKITEEEFADACMKAAHRVCRATGLYEDFFIVMARLAREISDIIFSDEEDGEDVQDLLQDTMSPELSEQ